MGNQVSNKPQSININADPIDTQYTKSQSKSHSLHPSHSHISTHSGSLSMSFHEIKLDHLTPLPSITARLSTARPITPDTEDTIPSSNLDPCTPLTPLPQQSQIQHSSSSKHKQTHRRNSSFCHVSNGITGTHISSRICKIAAKFWQQNIENLEMSEQLVCYIHHNLSKHIQNRSLCPYFC